MAQFVKGDVVVVPFPFSDLTHAKRRPALVIAQLQRGDVILCQITSQATGDAYAVPVDPGDFEQGNLNWQSNVRPNRLFTADGAIILYRAGRLARGKVNGVVEKIIEIIKQ